MNKTITIAGQKGGTGKSVTAVNLAASLSLLGKGTLLIDFDPKAYATRWCGIRELDYNCDISTVLSGRAQIKDAIVKTQFTLLDMIPSGFNLSLSALKLSGSIQNQKILKLLLNDIADAYDYIIIDTPSSYEFLSITGMTAADWLIVCMSVRQSYLDDFHSLLKQIKYIRKTHESSLKIAGFLLNRCKGKPDISSFLINQGLTDIENLVFNTFIPEDKNIDLSIDQRHPLPLHDVKSPAAEAYLDFSEEMIQFLQ